MLHKLCALIVDDEAPARARLARQLEGLDDVVIAGDAANGQQALSFCDQKAVDVVFLDIRMPGMDGVAFLQKLLERRHPPCIIYVTAYEVHALEVFEHNVVDYLLKPVRQQRLQQALAKARVYFNTYLNHTSLAQTAREAVVAKVGQQHQRIPIEDIYCFIANGKYVTVVHRHGECLLEASLKSLAEEFGDCFVRVHRTALIATKAISELSRQENGQYIASLTESSLRFAVSRRQLQEVKQRLHSHHSTSKRA